MQVTPYDLFAFGGKTTGPRLPRLSKDVSPDAAGLIGPEDPKNAKGASTFADVFRCSLVGPYHRLPAGTPLPDELGLVADGCDMNSASNHGPTHQTIYPAVAMTVARFQELFKDLPWQYEGSK